MNDPMVCERCGSPLMIFQEGRTQGLRCTHGDWSVVTTHTSLIKLDPTVYEIKIRHGNYENLCQIKAMSKVSRRSLLDARKLLKTDHPTAFKGDAAHAIEARDVLLAADLEIEVSPAFPW